MLGFEIVQDVAIQQEVWHVKLFFADVTSNPSSDV